MFPTFSISVFFLIDPISRTMLTVNKKKVPRGQLRFWGLYTGFQVFRDFRSFRSFKDFRMDFRDFIDNKNFKGYKVLKRF